MNLSRTAAEAEGDPRQAPARQAQASDVEDRENGPVTQGAVPMELAAPQATPAPLPGPESDAPVYVPVPALALGSPAPDFTLPDQHGAEYSLTEQIARRPATLVVFYPFAFSRICGGELRELQSAQPEFDDREVDLLAVSCDPMYALRVYAEQEGFGFPLLSDFWPHGAVARTYGVFDEARGCARRGSFLIDQEGVLRWSVVNPISQARPLADYLNALARLTSPHSSLSSQN